MNPAKRWFQLFELCVFVSFIPACELCRTASRRQLGVLHHHQRARRVVRGAGGEFQRLHPLLADQERERAQLQVRAGTPWKRARSGEKWVARNRLF